jgi:hypothetical protein
VTKGKQKLYVQSGRGTGTVFVLPRRNWHLEAHDTPFILPPGRPPYPNGRSQEKK